MANKSQCGSNNIEVISYCSLSKCMCISSVHYVEPTCRHTLHLLLLLADNDGVLPQKQNKGVWQDWSLMYRLKSFEDLDM